MGVHNSIDRSSNENTVPSTLSISSSRVFLQIGKFLAATQLLVGCSDQITVNVQPKTAVVCADSPPAYSELQEGRSIIGVPFIMKIQTPDGGIQVTIEFVDGMSVQINGTTWTIAEISSGKKSLKANDTVPIIGKPMNKLIDNASLRDGLVLHGGMSHLRIPDIEFRRVIGALATAKEGKDTCIVENVAASYSIVTIVSNDEVPGLPIVAKSLGMGNGSEVEIPVNGAGTATITYKKNK